MRNRKLGLVKITPPKLYGRPMHKIWVIHGIPHTLYLMYRSSDYQACDSALAIVSPGTATQICYRSRAWKVWGWSRRSHRMIRILIIRKIWIILSDLYQTFVCFCFYFDFRKRKWSKRSRWRRWSQLTQLLKVFSVTNAIQRSTQNFRWPIWL